MAEYSTNYTQNTTDKTFGTETYKFSRTVDVINPDAIDSSCIYCGAENGSKYDYYPTYNLGTTEKALMNSKWAAGGGNFIFRNSATDTPFNICFVKCGETGTADERGRNTVYQIGKTIYNKASSATNSSMRVLNPTDIRKLIFRPSFEGYTASPSSTFTSVDLKYLMDHPDDFFVQQMTMNVYAWNGSTFTKDSDISSIRPCIVGDNYFIPVNNVLGRHIFGMTDYNSQRDYTQSFYGTYDKDNMPMSFVPILTDETLTYDPNGSSGGGATTNNNKWKWSYNYYNSSYEIHAPARQVLQLMAYCGCYFIDNSYSTSGKDLDTFWNDSHIYLGEMKAGARTTGKFIKGTDLLTSNTINKGAFSSQTAFDPSGGGSDEDDTTRDASTYGTYAGGAGAFARCWAVNQITLNDLWLWMGETADPEADPPVYGPPEGFNPVNSIIGLLQFPVNIPYTTNKTSIVFWNAMAEGDRTVNTHVGAEGSEACYLVSGGTFEIDLGYVDLPWHHSSDWKYLDYDDAVELYIPYCGVFTVDTQAIRDSGSQRITAKLYVDPIAGTCTCIATCGNVDIAMGNGSMAVSMPVTVNQYSMTIASINNNKSARNNALIAAGASMLTQAASNFLGGYNAGYKAMENSILNVAGSYDDVADYFPNAVGMARGAGLRGGLSSATGAINNAFNAGFVHNSINSILNTRRANKMLSSSNNTAVCGSFGGSQDTWRLPQEAYIRVVRYRTKVPDNHVGTIGKIFLQETTLSNCTGYTTVANPNLSSLSGFLTAGELTELYGILCNGIYAGGGAS